MATTETTHDSHDDAHGDAPHAVPPRVLITVFVALVALTILTVFATLYPTGNFEIWISLGIATVKASLVAAYFMHLRYDNPLNALIFIFALFFVALFVGLCLMDTHQYQSDLIVD